LLELDRPQPTKSHRLLVKEVTLLDQDTGVDKAAHNPELNRAFLGDLSRLRQQLPFLEFE